MTRISQQHDAASTPSVVAIAVKERPDADVFGRFKNMYQFGMKPRNWLMSSSRVDGREASSLTHDRSGTTPMTSPPSTTISTKAKMQVQYKAFVTRRDRMAVA